MSTLFSAVSAFSAFSFFSPLFPPFRGNRSIPPPFRRVERGCYANSTCVIGGKGGIHGGFPSGKGGIHFCFPASGTGGSAKSSARSSLAERPLFFLVVSLTMYEIVQVFHTMHAQVVRAYASSHADNSISAWAYSSLAEHSR